MKSALALAAAGALTLTLAACGSGTGPATASGGQNFANGKTFTMVLGADPGNLDPQFTSLSAALNTDAFLYDPLVNIDPSGNMVAGLADKWSGNATTATYTLRKNITCSDGSPMTASVVAANINFVGDPKNASNSLGLFVPPGATATADDTAGTVTVTSPSPDPFLERNVGGLLIVCSKGMQDRSILKQGGDGTGMFTLSEAVAGDHYTFTRRKDYAWGPGNWKTNQQGLPDKVVLKVVSNETTAANLLLSGGANAASVLGADSQRLQAQKLFERSIVSTFGELWFNEKTGLPGADEAVRRALTQALDLSQLAQVVSSGTGKPATGLVSPSGPCRQNTVGSNLPAHDAAAAKATLDSDGWTAGPGGVRAKNGQKLSMVFYYPTSLGAGMQAGAELVQKVWSDLGVSVTLKGVTDAEAGQLIVGGQGAWNAAFIPVGVNLPTQIVSFLSGPTPPKGTNFAFINNAGYASNVQAASALVGASGCDKWAAAEESLFQHVDVVPFVDSTVPFFAKGATFELSQIGVSPPSIRMLG
jgi:peptide/nickel transport system substrate-binding protein